MMDEIIIEICNFLSSEETEEIEDFEDFFAGDISIFLEKYQRMEVV